MSSSNLDGKEYSTITVEAEYSHPGSDESIVQQWTFHDRDPRQAKDVVVRNYVPGDATLWRVGLWTDASEDRPEGGYESDILDDENE